MAAYSHAQPTQPEAGAGKNGMSDVPYNMFRNQAMLANSVAVVSTPAASAIRSMRPLLQLLNLNRRWKKPRRSQSGTCA